MAEEIRLKRKKRPKNEEETYIFRNDDFFEFFSLYFFLISHSLSE